MSKCKTNPVSKNKGLKKTEKGLVIVLTDFMLR